MAYQTAAVLMVLNEPSPAASLFKWNLFYTAVQQLTRVQLTQHVTQSCAIAQHLVACQSVRNIPYRRSQICSSRRYSFKQILSAGIDQLTGFDISLSMPVADSSRPPT